MKATDEQFRLAVRWQLRLREPGASAALQDEFLQWAGADPAHLAAYDSAEALWSAAGNAETDSPPDRAAIAALVASHNRPGKRRRAIAAACLGALMLANLGGLGHFYGRDLFDTLRADHVAWVGARERVVLADGSVIELNSGSSISVDLEGPERRVTLHRGEAYFEIAPDPARPFLLEMPEGQLRVTGTGFNVARHGAGAEIALLHGGVELTPAGGHGPQALRPGEAAVMAEGAVSAPAGFDPASRMAWREGRIVFTREPLEQVIARLGQYRRGELVLLARGAAGLTVTGSFDAGDIDGAIDLISASLGLQVSRLTGMLTLIR